MHSTLGGRCRALVAATLCALAACAGPADRPLAPEPAKPLAPSAATPPGASTVAGQADAALVISELLPNPNGTDDPFEWFEVHNAADTAVDLEGYAFGSANESGFTVPSGLVVPARGYALFVRSTAGPAPAGVPRYVYGTGSTGNPTAVILNNSNTDWVTVKDPDGDLVDSVAYAVRTNGTPGAFTPPNGASRAKRAMVRDCSTLADETAWGTATTTGAPNVNGDRGTPGLPNDVGNYTYAGGCGNQQPPGAVVTVTVTPSTSTINVGATRQLSALAVDANGTTVPTTFAWTSLNEAVATVSATGLVTGVAPGTATIRAVAPNGVAGEATVTVQQGAGGPTLSIVGRGLPPADPPLPVGFQDQFFANLTDANGQPITSTFTWSTTTPGLIDVDQLGNVTAKAAGQATVVATSATGVSGSFSFPIEVAAPSATARYGNHVEFGTPVDATPGDDFVVTREQFVSSWNRFRGQPNWVAYNLEATHRGPVDRCDCFTPDPLLPADFPVVLTSDYTNSGFTRGHLAMSEDRTAGYLDNARTFYFSNIVPQTAANNSGPWLSLEIYLGNLATQQNREVYIVAGGAAYSGTLKGEGRVAIPTQMWKVAVILPRDRGLADVDDPSDLEVIAVSMPNTTSLPSNAWEGYRVSVDSVESLTGYDLLSALPDALERLVESGTRPPTITALTAPATIARGATAAVGVQFTDPDGPADAPFRVAFDFGDGTGSTLSLVRPPAEAFTVPKAWAQPGTYVVRVTVTDKHGASASTQATVTVQ
jgi:DNA/RNA endonuclease G (NUC1)